MQNATSTSQNLTRNKQKRATFDTFNDVRFKAFPVSRFTMHRNRVRIFIMNRRRTRMVKRLRVLFLIGTLTFLIFVRNVPFYTNLNFRHSVSRHTAATTLKGMLLVNIGTQHKIYIYTS